MDPGTLFLLIVVWVLKNAVVDVMSVAKGTPNPRYEAKKAAAAANGRRVNPQARYFTRDYFADFWSDLLKEKTEIRRRQAAKKRAAEASVRSRPVPPINLDERPTAPPAADPKQTTRRLRQEADRESAPEPAQSEPEYEPTTGTTPVAAVLPFRLHSVRETQHMPADVIEVTGLTQAIAYTTDLAKFAGEHGSAGNETYISGLVAAECSGDCVTTAHAMQAAFSVAAAAVAEHLKELKKQEGVQEAYGVVPDAGGKQFQQNGQ